MAWSQKLTPPLVLKDGRLLETLSDARDMILGLAEGRQRAPYWQHGADLLPRTARTDSWAAADAVGAAAPADPRLWAPAAVAFPHGRSGERVLPRWTPLNHQGNPDFFRLIAETFSDVRSFGHRLSTG
jgi:hypothetical protein